VTQQSPLTGRETVGTSGDAGHSGWALLSSAGGPTRLRCLSAEIPKPSRPQTRATCSCRPCSAPGAGLQLQRDSASRKNARSSFQPHTLHHYLYFSIISFFYFLKLKIFNIHLPLFFFGMLKGNHFIPCISYLGISYQGNHFIPCKITVQDLEVSELELHTRP